MLFPEYTTFRSPCHKSRITLRTTLFNKPCRPAWLVFVLGNAIAESPTFVGAQDVLTRRHDPMVLTIFKPPSGLSNADCDQTEADQN